MDKGVKEEYVCDEEVRERWIMWKEESLCVECQTQIATAYYEGRHVCLECFWSLKLDLLQAQSNPKLLGKRLAKFRIRTGVLC